ncbi:hypothetical protein SCLCIDRAFT_27190 [Scleroderma citrinum Foug A]|uniref:Protein kinase domain-containing protein n=1 Tax=Scleroderma citrinum Foug A TaxID=1036808 RepID=A0A0C3A4M8_9AGAM|nr:hypothetical protein SCLCIDRAFT_27190 [Scleroderma citrinum Foug A]
MASAQAEDGSFPTDSTLSLLLDGEKTSTTFRVIRSFTPFTKGQVYLVEYSHSEFPAKLILKVYDPRFLDDRRLKPHESWTLAMESLVVQKWEQGQISDDFNICDLDDDVELEPWHWEAALLFVGENVQNGGCGIQEVASDAGPVYSQVLWVWKIAAHPAQSRATQPRAILIEYIPGVTLHDVDSTVVRPKLYRSLMGAVTRFDSLGVNHYDINANNIMLAPPKAPKRMVVIDFGFAGVRREGMTDEE